ncbi:MAG: hypothetical protein SNJ70_11395 [Armatimonadota bacterium]
MSNLSDNFAILVNSTDSFDYCWEPFFKLFDKYWPDCKLPIYLNTETKNFSYQNLDIKCTKVAEKYTGNGKPPWGWCLIECLKSIDADVILYLQEDYFLNDYVDIEQLEDFVGIIKNRKWSSQDCSHIGLSFYGSHNPYHITEFPLLWEIDRYAKYRICLQAGLWKKNTLLSYLKPNDTGWTFETLGSNRTRNDRLLTINRQIFNPEGRNIVPYEHTGIIKGRWNKKAVLNLFAENNISIDYSIRGFTDDPIVKKPRKNTKTRVYNLKYRILRKLNEDIETFRYHRL